MNENEAMMTVSEDTPSGTAAEAAAETPAEAPSEAVEEATKKKTRRGLKITILVIALVIAFAGVGAVSFFLGRNPDFDFSSLIPSFKMAPEAAEPAEFLGLWEGDEHSFYASAGNIIELDGVKYTCKWNDKTITLKTEDGEEIVIGYKRTSNRLRLWKDGGKENSAYFRRKFPCEAETLCGSWVHGDTVISFSDMGKADIYGRSYSYTADGFEITCKGKKGREYMFYSIDGDNLTLWQPGESGRKISFIREGSLIPKLVGTWVLNNGTEYLVVSKDGSVRLCDLTGQNASLYEGITDVFIEGEKFMVRGSNIQMAYSITLDNECMKLELASKLIGEYYRVSEKTNLSVNDVEFMWSIYSASENA